MAAPSPDLAGAFPIAAAPPTTARMAAPWRRLGVSFWLPAGWLTLITVIAVLAPVLHMPDPNLQDLANRGGSPGAGHLLGTDGLGRDMLARLVWGARISLTVGYASTLLGMALGTLLGMAAGYVRGRPEAVIVAAMDALLAFPALVLILAITTFVGHDLRIIVGVIGFLGIPAFARVARANTLALAQREFVLAARAMGASEVRILGLEILPNIVAPVLTFGLLAVAVAMLAEGALAFLGLSVPPPNASWGAMIAEGRSDLDTWPQTSLIPAAVFFLTIFALNLAADRLRRAVEVREARL
ncbi:MAG TPA: ABC transporter permease [Terriglobales bacterium]|nr:ABC transporter permease [Terriglobales bacterium]